MACCVAVIWHLLAERPTKQIGIYPNDIQRTGVLEPLSAQLPHPTPKKVKYIFYLKSNNQVSCKGNMVRVCKWQAGGASGNTELL